MLAPRQARGAVQGLVRPHPAPPADADQALRQQRVGCQRARAPSLAWRRGPSERRARHHLLREHVRAQGAVRCGRESAHGGRGAQARAPRAGATLCPECVSLTRPLYPTPTPHLRRCGAGVGYKGGRDWVFWRLVLHTVSDQIYESI